ncbi:MAG TPA: LexA family transcriptional regulator [Pelotomaculum sp.]|nr:LexA family transcriptional regulator [Pelotomaculum sp.]
MFANRLKELRERMGISQRELAKLIQLSPSTVAMYELGQRSPDKDTVVKLADLFSCTTDYLLGRDTPTLLPESFTLEEDIPVPILGSAPCGPSSTVIQEILGYIYIDKQTAEQGEHFALYAKGDSMEPTITPGDIVLIRKQPAVDNGQVAVVLLDKEEACIKRVFCNEGNCVLQSDNQKYQPKIVKQEEVLILGRVMEVRKRI